MFALDMILNALTVFGTLATYFWGLNRYGVWKALGLSVLAFIVLLFVTVLIQLTVIVVFVPMVLVV